MKKGDKVLVQKYASIGKCGKYMFVSMEVERVTPKQFVVGGIRYWIKDFTSVSKIDPWARNLTPKCIEYDESKDQTTLFNKLSEKEKLRVSCRRYSSQIRNLMVDFSKDENKKITSDNLRDVESKLKDIANFLNDKLS